MARRGTKNDLVKCEYCGEMYSVTYKHCPFCNEDGTGRWNEPEEQEDYYSERDARSGGGKRLAGGSRRRGNGPSAGSIIGGILSLILIIAAVCIVVSLVRSFLGGKDPKPKESAVPDPSAAVSTIPSTAPTQPALPSADPAVPSPGQAVEPSAPPVPTVTTPAVDLVTPTGFTLSKSDFTFDHVGEIYKIKVTYTPADAHGDISWRSSNPNVASVSWDGTVTAVSPGTVTVTATVAGVGEKSCIVRCSFSSTSAPASSEQSGAEGTQTPDTSSAAKLSRSDFTLSSVGDSWRLVVSGTSSAVTWASSNSEVATVGADGTVTAVSKGTCNVTATVDGVTLKCIVRCNW